MHRQIGRIDKPAAFTLVELLVVISIIALLLGILMPALQKARRSAMTVVCKSNLKQQGSAILLYVEDNKGSMPPSMIPSDGSSLSNNWQPLISKYFGNQKVTDTFWDKSSQKVWNCPAFVWKPTADWPSWKETDKYSYAMNLQLTYALDPPSLFPGLSTSTGASIVNKASPLKYLCIQQPTEKILVSDGRGWQVTFDWQMLYLVTLNSGRRHNNEVNVLMAGMNIESDTLDLANRYAQFKKYPNLYPYGPWKSRALRTWK